MRHQNRNRSSRRDESEINQCQETQREKLTVGSAGPSQGDRKRLGSVEASGQLLRRTGPPFPQAHRRPFPFQLAPVYLRPTKHALHCGAPVLRPRRNGHSRRRRLRVPHPSAELHDPLQPAAGGGPDTAQAVAAPGGGYGPGGDGASGPGECNAGEFKEGLRHGRRRRRRWELRGFVGGGGGPFCLLFRCVVDAAREPYGEAAGDGVAGLQGLHGDRRSEPGQPVAAPAAAAAAAVVVGC